MKDGTQYAKRIKRLQQEWQSKFGKQPIPEASNPVEQLVLGILARNTTEAKAQAVFDRMKQMMVDFNELRVTPISELAEIIGKGFPFALDKARRILVALNEIRRHHDTLDLSMLGERGRRDARVYLQSLEGIDPGTAARVMLFCFDGHAIPVDELTVLVLRKAGAADPAASVAEVQSFLERNVSAAECKQFVLQMSRYVAGESSHINADKLHAMVKPLECKTASGNMMADAARAAEEAALEAAAKAARAAEAKAAKAASQAKSVKTASERKTSEVAEPASVAGGTKAKKKLTEAKSAKKVNVRKVSKPVAKTKAAKSVAVVKGTATSKPAKSKAVTSGKKANKRAMATAGKGGKSVKKSAAPKGGRAKTAARKTGTGKKSITPRPKSASTKKKK